MSLCRRFCLLVLTAALLPAALLAGPDAGVVGIIAPTAEIAPGLMQPRARIANLGDSPDSIKAYFSIERPGGGFLESFTDSTLWPPAGWHVFNLDAGTFTWIRGTSFPYTPPAHATCLREASVLDNDDWLISPRVRVNPRDTLYFWFRALGPQMESLRVRVSLADSAPASFVHLLQAFDFNNTTYQFGWADFHSIGDTWAYIGFQYRMRAGQAGNGICLDDIQLRTAYLSDSTRTLVAPGDSATLNFASWNARLGHYSARCSVYQAGDTWPANNCVRLPFEVKEPPPSPSAWAEKQPMPSAPSAKDVKRGGWLAACDDNGIIYAAKGQKTGDFYSYSPPRDSWAVLSGIGQGTPGPNETDKGGRGICAGSNVYVVLGNNTHWFLRYNILSNTWTALERVPTGPSGKNVKSGSDLAYVPAATDSGQGHLYLLKGDQTEFYRYDIAANTWQQLENAPSGSKPRYKYGSWLARVGDKLYCHKASYHEFYAFDLATQQWSTASLPAMPFFNSAGKKKKAKDGSSAAVYDGRIYALKGGNTGEFWMFDPTSSSWTEKDTVPSFGSSGRKKRVNHGGDLCLDPSVVPGRFFALKGNKTRELWSSTVSAADAAAPPSGTLASGVGREASGLLTIAPNPLRTGLATLRWDMTQFGSANWDRAPSIAVFDASGRILQSRISNLKSAITLDTRGLRAGVYIVRLTSGRYSATQKLVIQR